jgi:hypothetical protein
LRIRIRLHEKLERAAGRLFQANNHSSIDGHTINVSNSSGDSV